MSGQDKTRSRAKPSRRRLVLAVCVAVAGSTAMVAWPLAASVGPRSHWLAQALTSRLFLSCAAVLVVCAVLFAVIAVMLWHAGKPHRTAGRGVQGVAILEFAMAFPFLLMLSLLMAQASLLMVGNVCVHYSAFCAARAAIVVIPQDYGVSEPRNLILDSDDRMSKKYRVRLSAVTALLPISCDSEDIMPAGDGGDTYVNGVTRFISLQGLDQPKWADERLSRKLSYANDPAHTKVTVYPPRPRPGDDDDGSFEDNEDVRVRVTHTFYLSVPTAARVFRFLPGGVDLNFGDNEYGTEMTATYTMPNEGVQDYVDIETFPKDAGQ